MNRRLLLLIVLAVLGATAWWLNSRSTGSTLDPTLSDFAIADTARVTRIHISGTLRAPVEVICEAFNVGLDQIAFDVRTLLP